MLLGLDFDNTIVRYDGLFHRLAIERRLVPVGIPATKQAIRDFLRAAGREDDWTELQGLAYGPRITDAEPFPGVKRFLARCCAAGALVAIISHKTRVPYLGEPHDLHAAAHAFLESHGFFATCDTGLSADHVFLEPTLAGKLARIGNLGCDAFIDDLPEVLTHSAFPDGVRKVLFDPADAHADNPAHTRVSSWAACGDTLLARREILA